LSTTSYVVLGLVSQAGRATPYELKQMAAGALGELWALRHAQLYAESERLAREGFLREEREEGGRRRKHYELAERGHQALHDWLREPTSELTELRDPGLLRLFFGADPRTVAPAQATAHAEKLAQYEERLESLTEEAPLGVRLGLEAGVAHEREWVEFWTRASADPAQNGMAATAPERREPEPARR
jgi:DNA-binding PadR family transcriptional regulator